ncbi:MAG: nuclear transport factor 2 family protein [Bacteroidales bacterium]|nr:nuclear transport factor 2 family protein [Bacteroidales bacterium]
MKSLKNIKEMYRIRLIFIIFVLTFSSCTQRCLTEADQTQVLNKQIDNWHLSAAQADFEGYFSQLDESAIYIGTDASELWTKEEFINFSKPFFDRGKAWDFKSSHRNIYFTKENSMAWFDELLETWMGPCRASGVMTKTDFGWKIIHYQLSVTVPNEKMNSFLTVIQTQN